VSWVERLPGRRAWRLRLLVLAVSQRCDQRCAHCSIWQGPPPGARALTLRERMAVVDDALAQGAREALLTGGEPLLSPDLWPLAARLRAAGARVMLATNGMLLARYAAAAASSFDEVYLSLDGASASTHDALRGVAAFERLRAGTRALRAAGPDVVQVARSTLHARNLHEVEGIVAAAAELGVDQVSFLPLDASSGAFGGDAEARAALIPSPARVDAFEAAVTRMAARGLLGGFVAEDAPRLRRLARHLRAGAGTHAFERPACDAPWWSSVVEADGAVRPCFFHAPVADAREGLAQARASLAYRSALRHIRAANPTCERCVCPKLRGPAWLARLRPGA
jgi:MoaA/NifB/PqqE/SkfB family radical SAM enzyme